MLDTKPRLEMYVRSVNAEFPRERVNSPSDGVASDRGGLPQVTDGWGRGPNSGLVNDFVQLDNVVSRHSLDDQQIRTVRIVASMKSRKEEEDRFLIFDPNTGAVFVGNQAVEDLLKRVRSGRIVPSDLDMMGEQLRRFYAY